MTSWVADLYDLPLVDLGDTNDELRGIMSPGITEDEVSRFIHSQFRADAGHYAEAYKNYAGWRRYIDMVFESPEFSDRDVPPEVIVDIGSGSGNSIFPMLEKYPDTRVIASDLSVELLSILRDELTPEQRDRVGLLHGNAEEMHFIPGSAQIVVGAAILHHLFAPEKAVASAHQALGEGGLAMFFEPCQRGKAFTRMVYEALMNDRRELPETARDYITSRMNFMDRRLRSDYDVKPFFERVDDKWNFAYGHFEQMADKAGFSKVDFVPLANRMKHCEAEIRVHFKQGRGVEEDTLPDWAWERIAEFDEMLTIDVRMGNPMSVAAVFTK